MLSKADNANSMILSDYQKPKAIILEELKESDSVSSSTRLRVNPVDRNNSSVNHYDSGSD